MVEEITLKRADNHKEIHMDQVSAPGYILDSVDWGTIPGKHQSYKYVNQIGESIENTTLETRQIVISGWVVAGGKSDMSHRKEGLNRFINPLFPVTLIYEEYKIEFNPQGTVKYSQSNKDNNEVICKFQIKGMCPNPMFLDRTENQVVFARRIPKFHFPLIIPKGSGTIMGLDQKSLIAPVLNSGDIPIGCEIFFKAKGTVLNPSLINIDTQEALRINKTLSADEEIRVNTSMGKKRIQGRIGNNPMENYFAYKDLSSSWLQLRVGKNLFRYNAESGIENLEVFIKYYNQFLEVEE